MKNFEFIFGIHTIKTLLHQAPHKILELYVQKGRVDAGFQELIEMAAAQDISLFELERHKLDGLVAGQNHQGIVAKTQQLERQYVEADLERLLNELTSPPFLLVLDGVQDPHNLGACLRSANAAGVHIVIAPQDRSVGLTPIARKTACGAAEITPFIQVTNLARTLRYLKERGIWLYGTADDVSLNLYETDLRGAIALILGAEGKGLRRLTKELCDYIIAIPMAGSVSSLNVSVATGVCLFEAVRQRR
jgi:23S rRNA (guanosine2251-2'-O)-methyltransferase